jgi:hypothetical protein
MFKLRKIGLLLPIEEREESSLGQGLLAKKMQ